MTRLVIVAYLASITAANLLVAHYGPGISVLNAFLLIGMDLTCRDYLHDTWNRHRARNMLALIAAAGALSYALNPASGRIALASVVAFTLSALADWAAYTRLEALPWHERSTLSNTVGAGVDSFVFPALAFGWPLLWLVMAGQFAAKVGGGALWALALGRWRARAALGNDSAP